MIYRSFDDCILIVEPGSEIIAKTNLSDRIEFMKMDIDIYQVTMSSQLSGNHISNPIWMIFMANNK